MSQTNKELHDLFWSRVKKDVAAIEPEIISRGYSLITNERVVPPGRKKPVIKYAWKHVCFVDSHKVVNFIYATIDTHHEEPNKLPESIIIYTQHQYTSTTPAYAVRAAIKHIEQCKPQIPT